MTFAKFLRAMLDRCDKQGMVQPFTVCVVSGDGSLFCLRIASDESAGTSAELLCSHPEEQDEPQLPMTIFVVDSVGKAGHGHVAVDDPISVTLAQ